MNRRLAAFSVLAALALGLLLVRMDAADANQSFMNAFKSEYPNAAAKLNSCSTCHTSAPSLNSYGTAFKNAGKTFTAALAAADSDGDLVSNGAEIAAGTMPGDASDKPATTTTTAATAPPATTATTAPTSTTPTTGPTTTSTTVSTVPSATAAAASPALVTSQSTASVFPMVLDLGAAGTVEIILKDGKLVAEVKPGAGWSFKIESEDDEVEVELTNGKDEVEVEAELDNGEVKVKIDTGSDDRHDDDDDDHSRGHDDDDDDDDDDNHGRGGHDDDDDHGDDDHGGGGHDDDDDD